MSRKVVIGGIAGLAAAALFVVVGSASGSNQLRIGFPSAVNLIPGAEVQIRGVVVGEVASVEVVPGKDAGAEVVVTVEDEHWPLSDGTRASIRWGSTVSYAARYVELEPAAEGAPLANGARLGGDQVRVPVEVDDLLNILDRPTRRSLGKLIDGSAQTFGPRARELRDAMRDAGPAFNEAATFFDGLGDDQTALDLLVTAGAATAESLANRRPELVSAVDGMAATFEEIAGNSAATAETLRTLPSALSKTTGTLSRLDPSLDEVGELVDELAPGASRIPRLARNARGALAELSSVAPALSSTLGTLRKAAPDARDFTGQARPVTERLGPILDRLVPMLECVRPYSREVGNWVGVWSRLGPFATTDGRYGRVLIQQYPFTSSSPLNSAEMAELFDGLAYGFGVPPGYASFDEKFLPDCGLDSDRLDPTLDPEAR